jgi:hypothetical protein
MQSLRHAHRIARFVLVWFALSIGVAIASPVVSPQELQLVCSSAGSIKLITSGDDGTAKPLRLTLDCPLCAGLGAPPPVVTALFSSAVPHFLALPVPDSLSLAMASATPPPARGPPTPA